jgi:hypothetical protein
LAGLGLFSAGAQGQDLSVEPNPPPTEYFGLIPHNATAAESSRLRDTLSKWRREYQTYLEYKRLVQDGQAKVLELEDQVSKASGNDFEAAIKRRRSQQDLKVHKIILWGNQQQMLKQIGSVNTTAAQFRRGVATIEQRRQRPLQTFVPPSRAKGPPGTSGTFPPGWEAPDRLINQGSGH